MAGALASPVQEAVAHVRRWQDHAIGRDALLRQKESGVTRRIVQFAMEDPEPLLYHNEPIWRDGEIVGYLTSGSGIIQACAARLRESGAEVTDVVYAGRLTPRPPKHPFAIMKAEIEEFSPNSV